ncbi:MAG: TlpA disulfide reductase family protein [Spirochaetia bacterium]|jgi:thiol-disulfide isomerase/thioredoxin
MRRGIAFLFLFVAAAAAHAGPSPADVALVNVYKDAEFTPGRQAPQKDYGDQKLYRLPNGTLLWVFTDGSAVAQTPDHVTISIEFSEGREYSRTIELPSGRTCWIDADKNIEWGLAKESAPDFALKTLGDPSRTIRLSDLRGKVVLLDFWASWCQPCMHALPDTEAAYGKYKSRGLQVFGINIEGDASRAAGAVKALGLTFPVLLAQPDGKGRFNWASKQIADYRIHGIPAMFLIDKNGVVQKEGDVAAEDIEKYLGQ